MKKAVPPILIGAVIFSFWVVLSRFFTIDEAKTWAVNLSGYAEDHVWTVFAVLFAAHAAGMLFSLPSKGILTLLAGALLGTTLGSIVTLAGALLGTTLLFFVSRCFLRERVSRKLGTRFSTIEERLSQHPIRAMIGLRLFITLPYGPISLVAALSSMRYRDFLVGTLIGDVPVVAAYCMAGQKLMSLTRMSEAISPWTAAAFMGIAVFFIVGAVMKRKKIRSKRGTNPP
jgi:uncharacterized membrane protein YdjX (TVP38/TMEM64 family)